MSIDREPPPTRSESDWSLLVYGICALAALVIVLVMWATA